MAKSLFDLDTLPATPAKVVRKNATTKAEKSAPVKAVKKEEKKPATKKAAIVQVNQTPVKAAATKPAKAPAIVQAFAAVGNKKDRYSQIQANRKAFSAYTIAALQVAGMIALSEKGAPIAKKGNFQLFGYIVGNTAKSHWAASGRIEGGQVSAAGLNEIQARLTGQTRGYNTDLSYVKEFAHAMQKGGTVEVNGGKFSLTSSVAANV